jgi:hypothetical protein
MRTVTIAPRRILALGLLLAGVAVTGSGCVVAAPGYGYVAGPAPVYVAPAPVVVAPAPVFLRGRHRWR